MTMDPKTAEALEASIRHWEENERAEKPAAAEVYSEGCALCQLFSSVEAGLCAGCPVMERTGKNSCEGSPWAGASGAWERWRALPTQDRRVNFRVAARKEIGFLKSLRDTPEETS